MRRGHEVCLQTWERWREEVEREGMRFEAAPRLTSAGAGSAKPPKPYQAAVQGAHATQPLIEDFAPDAVVVDILTVAASLAADRREAEAAGRVPDRGPEG